eukprot:5033781-Lingulodinium_polyedra.AAC.1
MRQVVAVQKRAPGVWGVRCHPIQWHVHVRGNIELRAVPLHSIAGLQHACDAGGALALHDQCVV